MEKYSVDFWKIVLTERESLDYTTLSQAHYSETNEFSLKAKLYRENYCRVQHPRPPAEAGFGWNNLDFVRW